MKTKVLALLGVLIVTGGVIFGVNTALGDPPTPETIPKEPKPEFTPPPFPAHAPPVIGLSDEASLPVCNWPDPDAAPQPFEINAPCFTDPNAAVPNFVPLPSGEFFPLPPGATWSTSSRGDGVAGTYPASAWPETYHIVTLGNSSIKFAEDAILDSHVEPQDAEALAPLLNELKP